PYVLDFLSAARGYGLAMGCLLAALDRIVRWLSRASRGARPAAAGLIAGSIWLGLSVAANLAFLFPAAGLLIAAVILLWIVHGRPRTRAVLVVCGALMLPAAVISGAIAGVPLMHATRLQFYFGASTLNSMISSLVHVSFLHGPSMAPMADHPPGAWDWGRSVIAAIPCAAALAVARSIRSGTAAESRIALSGLLLGTMLMTVAVLVLVHRVFAVLYPLGRTA